MTSPVKKTRARRRTCGDKRGTRTGSNRHTNAGEWSCRPCHIARSLSAGKSPMSRRRLRRWRKTRKAGRGHARRQRSYREGYQAGLVTGLRDRAQNPTGP